MITNRATFAFCILLLTIVFSSCMRARLSEYGDIPTTLIDSLKALGHGTQQTEIDPTKDNVIKGDQGTVFYIAANSLIDDSGKPVSAKTTLELEEHFTIADVIAGNLQTVHDEEILQSQGMIYFSIKTSDGSTVKIDKSKPIRIEIPVDENIPGTKIFTGLREGDGKMNWPDTKETSKYLIPFPIRFISRCDSGQPGNDDERCPICFGMTSTDQERQVEAPDGKYLGDIDKFENTFLATREFLQRFSMACSREILAIYIDNLKKNMWEADELAVKLLIEDSIRYTNEFIKQSSDGQDAGGNPAKYFHVVIDAFKEFAQQRLTNIDPLKRAKVDTTIAATNRVFVAYDALDFGWVNVDHFYIDPKAVPIKLAAETNERAPIINLIFPERKIILSGIEEKDNQYRFSKNEDGYNKLPKGERAILMAMSLADDGQLHFALKEIVIGEHETEALHLKKTPSKEIQRQLKDLGKLN